MAAVASAPVNGVDSPADSAPAESSMILPPPAIRAIVDKTAAFVAKSPNAALFEDKIRAREKSDSRFAFLNATDAYHAYYQHRLEAFRRGEAAPDQQAQTGSQAPGASSDAATAQSGAQTADVDAEAQHPPEPPALEFLVEHPPPMNAVDLDILHLTALFTARSGRKFTSELASRESRNYQFDFLRPSHSLFSYFNRLVEQYTKMLIPSAEAQAQLERRAGGPPSYNEPDKNPKARREVLKDAKTRVEWEKWDMTRRKELEDAQEAERIAFAEIDWQDFVVASTIEFTEADEAGLVELPPPMSLSEVENMTLAQKKMAAMIMEGQEEPGADTADGTDGEGEMDMDEGVGAESGSGPSARTAKDSAQPKADTNAPIKIRKDYVPKAKRPAQAAPAYTTFGDQQVPVEEFAQHIRYELLDPRWKEEKRRSDANRSASNLLPGGTDVVSSIRDLAAHRPDIFGTGNDEEIKKRQEELLAQSKAREANVWDGHTATKDAITSRYQANATLHEQFDRAKGLGGPDDEQEPKIGPAVPAAPPPTEPVNPLMTGASMSAAPQPQPTPAPPPVYPGGPGFSGPPMTSGLPSRPYPDNYPPYQGNMPHSGYGRPAEDNYEDERSAKRQRIEKRTDGSLWPESDWIAAHPDDITIKLQMPDYPSKPAWGCDGTILELDVPLTLQVGILRDRIMAKRGLPISKQKFTYNGKPLTNQPTLASLNFEDGDVIQVSVKEKK